MGKKKPLGFDFETMAADPLKAIQELTEGQAEGFKTEEFQALRQAVIDRKVAEYTEQLKKMGDQELMGCTIQNLGNIRTLHYYRKLVKDAQEALAYYPGELEKLEKAIAEGKPYERRETNGSQEAETESKDKGETNADEQS